MPGMDLTGIPNVSGQQGITFQKSKEKREDKPRSPRYNPKSEIADLKAYIEILEGRMMVQDSMIAQIKLAQVDQRGSLLNRGEILARILETTFADPDLEKFKNYLLTADTNPKSPNHTYRLRSCKTILEMVTLVCEVRAK